MTQNIIFSSVATGKERTFFFFIILLRFLSRAVRRVNTRIPLLTYQKKKLTIWGGGTPPDNWIVVM